MPTLEREPVVVSLGDDAPALKHHEAIGERLGEQAADSPFAAMRRLKGDRLDRTVAAPERGHRRARAIDAGRRQDFPDMLERPAIEGRPQPIGQRHLPVGQGWKPLHQRTIHSWSPELADGGGWPIRRINSRQRIRRRGARRR